jgi:hypothetical protein
MKHQHDKNTAKIRDWIRAKSRTNRKRLDALLKEKGLGSHGITHVLCAKDFKKLRSTIVTIFKIK